MKCMLKIVRFLVGPFTKRGFSRADLIVLLFLSVMAIIDLLLHAFLPTGVARVPQAVQAQAQVQNANKQAGASLTSLMATSFQAPSVPRVPTSSQGSSGWCLPHLSGGIFPISIRCADNNTSSSASPDPCPSHTSYVFPNTGNIRGPLGGSSYLFFFTDRGITVDECHVQAISNVMTYIVNIFVAILIILAGLRIMLGGSVLRYASAIEILPGILLALLAANLCLPITGLAMDLSNALTNATYTTLDGMPASHVAFDGNDIVTQTCNHWYTLGGILVGGGFFSPLTGFIGEEMGCNMDPYTTDWASKLQDTPQVPDLGGGFLLAFKSLSDLLGFTVGIMALMLMGQMALRVLLIDFYIVTGPLGMGAWALPGNGGKSLTRMWLQDFFTVLFSQFLQVIALIVVRLVVGAITSGLYASLHGPGTTHVTNDSTLLWVMQIAQYWFLIRIPSLISTRPTSPLNMMVNFGQTMAQTAQTVVGTTLAEIQFATSMATSALSLGIAR